MAGGPRAAAGRSTAGGPGLTIWDVYGDGGGWGEVFFDLALAHAERATADPGPEVVCDAVVADGIAIAEQCFSELMARYDGPDRDRQTMTPPDRVAAQWWDETLGLLRGWQRGRREGRDG